MLGDGKRGFLWEALRMQQQVYTSRSSDVYSWSRILMVQIMAYFQTDTVVNEYLPILVFSHSNDLSDPASNESNDAIYYESNFSAAKSPESHICLKNLNKCKIFP
jgi:hypothetical protein